MGFVHEDLVKTLKVGERPWTRRSMPSEMFNISTRIRGKALLTSHNQKSEIIFNPGHNLVKKGPILILFICPF
jgi:hypothetical protein